MAGATTDATGTHLYRYAEQTLKNNRFIIIMINYHEQFFIRHRLRYVAKIDFKLTIKTQNN